MRVRGIETKGKGTQSLALVQTYISREGVTPVEKDGRPELKHSGRAGSAPDGVHIEFLQLIRLTRRSAPPHTHCHSGLRRSFSHSLPARQVELNAWVEYLSRESCRPTRLQVLARSAHRQSHRNMRAIPRKAFSSAVRPPLVIKPGWGWTQHCFVSKHASVVWGA